MRELVPSRAHRPRLAEKRRCRSQHEDSPGDGDREQHDGLETDIGTDLDYLAPICKNGFREFSRHAAKLFRERTMEVQRLHRDSRRGSIEEVHKRLGEILSLEERRNQQLTHLRSRLNDLHQRLRSELAPPPAPSTTIPSKAALLPPNLQALRDDKVDARAQRLSSMNLWQASEAGEAALQVAPPWATRRTKRPRLLD
mmetsp:Transcript_129542/g.258512  ORF Transcript_129542/g.258512 Transcript_129542/m.258512 type:complete len:198 (+) Transcript_129542:103-696(+)